VRLRYSNFGFGLLGYVLARRAEASYDELVRDRICAPLGLADTGLEIHPNANGRFADGHNRRGRTAKRREGLYNRPSRRKWRPADGSSISTSWGPWFSALCLLAAATGSCWSRACRTHDQALHDSA